MARTSKSTARGPGFCAECGVSHDASALQPAFIRPDAYLAIPEEDRESIAGANEDYCAIFRDDGREHYVRAVLPIVVDGKEEGTSWGIWARVGEDEMDILEALSKNPDLDLPSEMPAKIANQVPGYPPMLGLDVRLRVGEPRYRPSLFFPPDATHPFAVECLRGVTAHRVLQWLNRG